MRIYIDADPESLREFLRDASVRAERRADPAPVKAPRADDSAMNSVRDAMQGIMERAERYAGGRMGFEEVLRRIKAESGPPFSRFRREVWPEGQYIRHDIEGPGLTLVEPYGDERSPWIPTTVALFADDWYEVERYGLRRRHQGIEGRPGAQVRARIMAEARETDRLYRHAASRGHARGGRLHLHRRSGRQDAVRPRDQQHHRRRLVRGGAMAVGIERTDGGWTTFTSRGRPEPSVKAMIERVDPAVPWDVLVHIVTEDGAVIIPYEIIQAIADEATCHEHAAVREVER